MGADIFSILGVRNIANWVEHWARLYENSIGLSQQRNPGRLASYNIKERPSVLNGYLGYTMQQYITKSKQGVRRPTKAYEQIINSVPDIIEESMGPFFGENTSTESAKLGDIPHLYSLIPLAQSVATPILDLKSSDGLVGAQYKQREDYENIIKTIAKNLYANLGESA